ncbi:MAG: ABC transporter permease [Myxococcota bacterium]
MLLSLFRIAFRNVTRNTKRSLITMAAVIIGCAAIVFARGFINGLHSSMIDGITETMTGDVQLHQQDYLKATDALPLNLSIKLDEKVEGLLKEESRVDAWSGRLRFTGMLSNGLTTSLFIGNALDPDNEYKVTPQMQTDLAEGKGISNAEPSGVVVADKLAKAMKLKLGDSIVLTASTKDGALNTMDATVVGIRKSMAALSGTEGMIVDIPLKTAQDLLYMPGEVTEIIVNVPQSKELARVADDLHARFQSQAPELKVSVDDWSELSTSKFFVDILDMQDRVLWIVIGVLFAVMVTGIVNTMLMAVLERVREIGTMMAVGVRRNKIVTLFICEAMALGIIGSVTGGSIGYAVILGITVIKGGIAFTPAAFNKPVFVVPEVSFFYIAMVVLIAIIAGIVAAIYPALRASKLEPSEALRTV